MGMACGLERPIEWYVNAMLYSDRIAENLVRQYEESLQDAFIAFLRGTGSHPGDSVEYLDKAGLNRLVEKYYGL